MVQDIYSYGVEGLSSKEQKLAVNALFTGLQSDCEDYGFEAAPTCKPGEMRAMVHAVTKGN